MFDESEKEEFERRRQAAWKSAFQGAGASEAEYFRKKKKQLTLAERQQQIKGLSKAFVNPGAGWAKVDPVYVVEDDEDDDIGHGSDSPPKDSSMVVGIQEKPVTAAEAPTTEPSKQKAESVVATTEEASPSRDFQQQMKIQVLDHLLQVARTHGSNVALSWAEKQVQDSGVSNSSNQVRIIPPPALFPTSFLPLPLRLFPFNTPQAVEQERQHYSFFREAAQYTPNEYTSSTDVIFVVRRPYGYESRPGLFERMSEQPNDRYKRKAHISSIETLEVAVLLKPNLSVLLLYGDGEVIYRPSPTQRTLQGGNLKLRLGTITYPAGDDPAQPQTLHSLDSLAQQALSLRQQYAVTMTTTAISLFKTKPIKESISNKSMSSVDVGVDTLDLVTGTRKSVPTNTSPSSNHNARVQHFSWWIRKKLLTMLLRRSGTWGTLFYLIVLAGVLYLFFKRQFVLHDLSIWKTKETANGGGSLWLDVTAKW